MTHKVPYALSNGHLSVEVRLKCASDVFLVDSQNYAKYSSGKPFKYFGGHYTTSPVHISVNGTGRWYLIVLGEGQYEYRFYE